MKSACLSEATLALLSGGDLPVTRRWAAQWHARRCETCHARLQQYRNQRESLHAWEPELPAGLRWEDLAWEMRANIHVGVAAAACVRPKTPATVPVEAEQLSLRIAVAVFALTLIIITGWFFRSPAATIHGVRAAWGHRLDTTLRTTPTGVEVTEGAARIELRHSNASAPAVLVSQPDALQVGFVDRDSGQVTINHVLAD